MLKILQARPQQYVNRELPDVQAGFRKCRRAFPGGSGGKASANNVGDLDSIPGLGEGNGNSLQYSCPPPKKKRKCRGTRDQIANICWIIEKAREFQEVIYICLCH